MIETLSRPESLQEQAIRVLVLDDEDHARRMTDRLLTRSGCLVQTAENGREGLQVLLESDFDVLVIDVHMDGMDGPTFLREARKIWPWLGVVIVSGLATAEDLAALEVEHVLQKPLVFEQLRASVLAEAEAKRARVAQPAQFSLDQIQYQLGILRQLSETAIKSGSIVDALRGLSDGLARLLPCAVAGVLGEEQDKQALVLTLQRPVGQEFLLRVQEEVCHQYTALTGRLLDASSLSVQYEGLDSDEAGPSEIGSTFTVPVISGGELHGLLILGSETDDAYSTVDIAFLYHAANHLSSVFAALSQMRELAIHDSLTGLYNRRRLEEELDLAWERCHRYGHVLSVAVIDLDMFKRINDEYGHLVGDDVLRELAELIRGSARTTDVVGRYGGDEMVVLFPEGGAAAARVFSERFLGAVRRHAFCESTHAFRMTASVGIAHSESACHPQSGREVFHHADQALGLAKRAGRNRVAVWSPELSQASVEPNTEDASMEVDERQTSTCRGRILVVDDEPDICRPLKMVLESQGFEVGLCENVRDAVDTLAGSPGVYDVVVTDLHMPGQSGFDLLRQLSRVDASIVKVVATGNATMENAVECLRHGAYDFIEKPIATDQLMRMLDRALEYRQLHLENARYRLYLEEMVRERSAALSDALEQVTESHNFTLEAMVALLDAREKATGQHTLRVRKIAELMAGWLELPAEDVETIGRGALLHDIGKIAIPDHVLLKPGSLTDAEQAIMREHAEIGYRVLQKCGPLKDAAEIVWSHHEQFDGSGYPRGLREEEICHGARIFCLADAWDAMRSNRPYRQAMSVAESAAEIRKGRGTQFDPDLADLFLAGIEEIEQVGGWGGGGNDE